MEKPARYIGGEVGSIVKEDASLRVVLSYPDVYELGTANQAVQILYSLINGQTGAAAERAYCPWGDMAGLMREEGVPLFTLERWLPVREADLWGLTLQFELTYTNILEMLDLAGVPLHQDERGADDPLVFAGGPCASNPHPVNRFFDFLVIGDGEEVVIEALRICEENRGLERGELLGKLAELEGIYVPSLSRPATRAVVTELKYENLPLRPIIPSMQAVHDRATVEVMRGCTRGCRFCMAGTWYRPVRERPPEDVLRATRELVANTGYEEASLSSLSTTDYSGIQPVLKKIAEAHPELSIALPSLRVDSASYRLLGIASPVRGSITLAPEAGSQRLRDVINKQVTDDDIFGAITEAFRLGCTTVKLYFMIGLSTETEADLQGIIDIAVAARRIGRQTAKSPGRAQVNVSVASFVPKAHTPFQWDGMDDRASLEAKQQFLRREMPRKQIKLSLHDLKPSLVESAIARGDDETAGAIEAAWKAGARFDAWSDRFDYSCWEKGFAAIGRDIDSEASRSWTVEAALPWDDIDSRVDKDFLIEEREKSQQAEITPDCRWGPCTLCEVCVEEIRMRVAGE